MSWHSSHKYVYQGFFSLPTHRNTHRGNSKSGNNIFLFHISKMNRISSSLSKAWNHTHSQMYLFCHFPFQYRTVCIKFSTICWLQKGQSKLSQVKQNEQYQSPTHMVSATWLPKSSALSPLVPKASTSTSYTQPTQGLGMKHWRKQK